MICKHVFRSVPFSGARRFTRRAVKQTGFQSNNRRRGLHDCEKNVRGRIQGRVHRTQTINRSEKMFINNLKQ